MNQYAVTIGKLLIGCSLAVFGSFANAAKPETVSIDVPVLSGGDVARDALNVATMPFLALPPSIDEQNEDALAAVLQANVPWSENYLASLKSGVGLDSTTGPMCATGTGPLPAPGWTLTYAGNVSTCAYPWTSGYYSVCFGVGHYCFNQMAYTSYNDIPVGGTLRFCSVVGVPNGWSVTQVNLSPSCPGSGEDWVMQHTACVAGDTNCYPTSASIYASPQTLTVPYGQEAGSTTVSWNSTNYADPCVWIQSTGGTKRLWACLGTGAHSAVWPWVPAGGTTTFTLSSGGSNSPTPSIAQVVATGIQGTAPSLSASPMIVYIPQGNTRGSTTVSYNLSGSGYASMCVWEQTTGGSGPSVWACPTGKTWSGVWPYVPKGGSTTFWLSPSQTSPTPRLVQIVVTGQ